MGEFDLGNASPEVVKDVKREVAQLERALRGGAMDSRTGIGANLDRCGKDLREELGKKKTWLNKYEPEKLTGTASNKAFKRVTELKARISGKLQSNKNFHQFYPKNQRNEKDFHDSVQHEAALMRDKDYKRDVTEYRALMRQIDPSDPTVVNIELLRSGKHVRIRG